MDFSFGIIMDYFHCLSVTERTEFGFNAEGLEHVPLLLALHCSRADELAGESTLKAT